MKYFIKKDKNNIINDIISYEKEWFIEIELEIIPDYFISWAYSYINWEIFLNQTVIDKIKQDELFLINNQTQNENIEQQLQS